MLQTKAMLTNLVIRAWTAQKTDKKVSKEVEKTHNAVDAGRYTKLLVDKKELEALSKNAGKIRDTHYEMTLPWGDNGDRLLPSRMYMKYTQAMRELKNERENLSNDLANRYPQLIVDAAKRLGTMYDPREFPKDIKGRFNVELSFSTVPDANDFRVDVSTQAAEEIKKNITASVAARQEAAMQNCWKRMKDVLEKMVERLADSEAVFRDSLFENVRNVGEVVPDLNILDDNDLERICNDMRNLGSKSPDRARNERAYRAACLEYAQQLLELIEPKIKDEE